jgi:hypothetical protein
MQRIDERSLVKAEKPELVLLETPELNAETPAHHARVFLLAEPAQRNGRFAARTGCSAGG